MYGRPVPAEPPAADPDQLWRRVREELARSLPDATLSLWFEPLQAVAIQGGTLLLSAPTGIRTWVERRYASLIAEALGAHGDEVTRVGFVAAPAPGSGGPDDEAAPASQPLDPGHTFDSFVIGPGNRLAHAAALACAELPGEAYNPLFLHGPPGLGKTHLLGAIADYMRRQHPGLEVHYTTAERFTTEFVLSLRRDGPERFKERYRTLDALLIDDVQVLEGKQRTEEEFVHTFNALFAAGKQVVLSSDRPPEALSQLAERLRDRFSWGLRVELEPPDLRTRIALLWRLVDERERAGAEPAVLHEIAARSPGNVRALEGAMTRVLAVASLLSEPLSSPLVRRALGEGAPARPAGDRGITLEQVQLAVCTVHGIERSDLLSRRRAAPVTRARQQAMYLARELTPLSLAEIARGFDRDHSTVLHATRAVGERLEPGSETAESIQRAKLELGRGGGGDQAQSTTGDVDPAPDSG